MPTALPLTPAQERLWRAIARMMVVLPRAIDEDLLSRTGLVRRAVSPLDHRANIAALTDTGFDPLVRAWPDHVAGVRNFAINHIRRSETA